MCQWVGPHAPSFGRQLWGLPSRVEYLLPQGVLLPLVYSTTTSLLWLELRGLSVWQATPSWTVYQLSCQRLLPWLRVTFAMVPDAAWPGSDQQPWGTAPAAGPVGRLGRPSAPDPWVLVLSCPFAALRVHVCVVSWATWLLFTGVPAWCVALLVRWPGPLGSFPPVCPLGVLFCLCGALGHLAPVHRCARSVRCFACWVSWATWLLFTGVPAQCVALRVRCPWPLGLCSLVCPLGVLFCLCGVLGHLAPVHQCARSVRCFACAVSWATWLLFTCVPARCVVLLVRCPGPLGSCSPACPLGALPACAVSWATWLLFSGVPARRVVLLVRCPGPPGFCSPVCPFGALFYLCSVPGHSAPVHRCARPVRCLRVRCPGQLGSCSGVCPLGALFCLCGVLGHLAPVHRCSRSACCVVCAVSWATWLPFTGVPARRVVLYVRCPGPLGSCSRVCPLCVQCGVCVVLGHSALVHRCARSACCVVCALSWATWLMFTGVPARCVVLRVRCPVPVGSCSPVCPLGVLCCVCGVLGHLAPVHRCARSVRCLRVRCPGPLGSCSPVCPLGVLCCVCGVLGHLASVHR